MMASLSRRLGAALAIMAGMVMLAGCGSGSAGSTRLEAAMSCADAGVPGRIRPQCWPEARGPIALDAQMEDYISELIAAMTVEEKVGQIIQADLSSVTPDDVRRYHLGSILNGGNSGPNGNDRAPAPEWLAAADAFYEASLLSGERAVIPLIWGTDAVHGHNNIIGATIFPHNIGLGAANDADLIRRIGAVTAREVLVTGQDWTFAPTLAVARDDRWGRTYESYSEDPDIVARYAGAMVEGLQGVAGTPDFLGAGRVVSTAKHFLGDGGTQDGRDQGDARMTEADLRDIHNAGYPPSINAGAQTIMASFSSYEGRKMHGFTELLTGVVKEQMGFDGFIVGDWNGHGQVDGCTNESCPAAINAGLDMFMAPDSWRGLYENTLAQARSGVISEDRLNDAVRRILRVKIRAGLFDKPRPSERPLAGDYELLGSPEHRAVAREAVRKSLVLLKNERNLLPLAPDLTVLVAGPGANDMGRQTGGWTLSWQGDGNTREEFPNGETIWEGIRDTVRAGGGRAVLSRDGSYTAKPDVAIVVYGETPYAEFRGDVETLEYSPGTKPDLALLRSLREDGIPVVSVFLSGRPMWVNRELNASHAFVAAWLPGSEGGGVADLLFTDRTGVPRHDFTGRLSFSWPRTPTQTPLNVGQADYDPLFPYGYGLSVGETGAVAALPEDTGPAPVSVTRSQVFFENGSAAATWSLFLTDASGEPVPVSGAQSRSTQGIVRTRTFDYLAQEDALALTWTGRDMGAVLISGPPVNLEREANGDVAMHITYRLDRSNTAPVALMMGCGPGCEGRVDLSEELASAPLGQWRVMRVRLACFGDQGARMSAIEQPFALFTDGALGLSLSRVALEPGEGGAACVE